MLATDPPGLVHEHVDLDKLADEIKALHVEAEEHSRKGVKIYVLIGERLLKAKAQVGHGNWLGWLRKLQPCSERQARNYMRLAKSAVTADLESAWRIIQGNEPEDDDKPAPGLFGQPTEPWPAGYKPCRHHRINTSEWSAKCKDCRENNKSSDAPPTNGSTSAAGTTPAGSGAAAEGHGGPSAGSDPTDYIAFWKRHGKTLHSRLKMMRVALVIPSQALKAAQEAFRIIEEFIKANATAPIRQPEKATCKKCQRPVLWVTTAAHKRAMLDDKAKGPVHIQPDGLAVQVTEADTGFKSRDGRQWHYMMCVSKEPIA